MKLLQNALRIEEDSKITYLNSVHRHDYVGYSFKGSESNFIFIDGGCEYRRCGGRFDLFWKNIEDWSLTTKDNFKKRANRLLWGHTNPNGTGEFKYSLIKDLELTHLINIKNYLAENGWENSLHYKVVSYWINQKQKQDDGFSL